MNSENMKRLYAAAESFRKLAPWEWMDDDRIFGVKNPETGVIDYCGVLGALGEVFALVVYEGPEGLHGYLKLISGELGEAGTPSTRSVSSGSAVSRKSAAAFGRSAVATPPCLFRNGAMNAPICRDSWESSRRKAV